MAGHTIGGVGADSAGGGTESAEAGGRLAVLLGRTDGDASVGLVVAEGATWTLGNALACCVGVSDDGGGYAGLIAVAIEKIITWKALGTSA